MFLKVKQAVLAALDCGYRHIDCAAAYNNEQEVGEALALRVGPGKVRNSGYILILKVHSRPWNQQSQLKVHILSCFRAFYHIPSSVNRPVVMQP